MLSTFDISNFELIWIQYKKSFTIKLQNILNKKFELVAKHSSFKYIPNLLILGVSEPLVNTPNSSLVSLNEDATSKQSEGMSEKGEGFGGKGGVSEKGEGFGGKDGVSEKGEGFGGKDGVSEKGESAGGRDGVSEKGEGAGGRDGVSGNIEIERGLIVWRKRILFNQEIFCIILQFLIQLEPKNCGITRLY